MDILITIFIGWLAVVINVIALILMPFHYIVKFFTRTKAEKS